MFKIGIALVLAIILLIPGALVGGNLVFRATTGVDLISSAVYAAQLTAPVDESIVCPDAITQDDMVKASDTINNSVANMIVHNNGQFTIDLEQSATNNSMNGYIKLNGKEVASLAQIIMSQEDLGQIGINEETYIDVAFKQVNFESIDRYNTRVSVVMTINTSSIKQEIKAMAFGDAINDDVITTPEQVLDTSLTIVPDILYVTSTFVVEEAEGFECSIAHESLAINSLTVENTVVLFNTVNFFSKLGDAQYFNEQIANAIMDALIGTPGNDEDTGFAESLQDLGATGYDFVTENGVTYFVVK